MGTLSETVASKKTLLAKLDALPLKARASRWNTWQKIGNLIVISAIGMLKTDDSDSGHRVVCRPSICQVPGTDEFSKIFVRDKAIFVNVYIYPVLNIVGCEKWRW